MASIHPLSVARDAEPQAQQPAPSPRSRGLSFRASALARLALALLYSGGCLAAVLVIRDHGSLPALPQAVGSAAADVGAPIEIALDATYPVATWRVDCDGAAVVPTVSDARHWRGSVIASAGHALSITAEHADPLDDGLTALRIDLSGRMGTQVCDVVRRGTISITLPIAATEVQR